MNLDYFEQSSDKSEQICDIIFSFYLLEIMDFPYFSFELKLFFSLFFLKTYFEFFLAIKQVQKKLSIKLKFQYQF